jgi:hypothetical protein
VKKDITDQAIGWYSMAIESKKTKEEIRALGQLCHMIQDSYCLSHCWRRYEGDENISSLPRIDPRQKAIFGISKIMESRMEYFTHVRIS